MGGSIVFFIVLIAGSFFWILMRHIEISGVVDLWFCCCRYGFIVDPGGMQGIFKKMVSTVISMGEDPTQLCLRGIVIDLA